jgi:AAA domain
MRPSDHRRCLSRTKIQLAPELFRSIKVTVDTDQRPGQFLLTGSAQVLALRELPDALPGRMEIIELWPFSQGELERSSDAFIDAAFARGTGLSRTSPLRKRDYLDRIARGGYPEAIRRAPRRRAAFFDSYLTNLIERDVQELAAIERRGDLRRLRRARQARGCSGPISGTSARPARARHPLFWQTQPGPSRTSSDCGPRNEMFGWKVRRCPGTSASSGYRRASSPMASCTSSLARFAPRQ